MIRAWRTYKNTGLIWGLRGLIKGPGDLICDLWSSDLGFERLDLGFERLDLWSERPNLGSEMPDLGFERPDLGSKRSD